MIVLGAIQVIRDTRGYGQKPGYNEQIWPVPSISL